MAKKRGMKVPAMKSCTTNKAGKLPTAMGGSSNKVVGKTKPGMLNNNDQHSKSCSCTFCGATSHSH